MEEELGYLDNTKSVTLPSKDAVKAMIAEEDANLAKIFDGFEDVVKDEETPLDLKTETPDEPAKEEPAEEVVEEEEEEEKHTPEAAKPVEKPEEAKAEPVEDEPVEEKVVEKPNPDIMKHAEMLEKLHETAGDMFRELSRVNQELIDIRPPEPPKDDADDVARQEYLLDKRDYKKTVEALNKKRKEIQEGFDKNIQRRWNNFCTVHADEKEMLGKFNRYISNTEEGAAELFLIKHGIKGLDKVYRHFVNDIKEQEKKPKRTITEKLKTAQKVYKTPDAKSTPAKPTAAKSTKNKYSSLAQYADSVKEMKEYGDIFGRPMTPEQIETACKNMYEEDTRKGNF